MDLIVELLVAIAAVGGLALGAFNWWKAGPGKVPRFEFEVEHLEGARYRLVNTGRKTATVTRVSPDSGSLDGFPELFEMRPLNGVDFTVVMWPDDEHEPTSVDVVVKEMPRRVIIASVPYSKEVRTAQSWSPPTQ